MEFVTAVLPEEQRALRQAVREFAEDMQPPVRRARMQEALDPHAPPPPELVREAGRYLGELGLPTIVVPERYGGVCYDTVTQAVITEELARGDVGLGVTQNWKVSSILADHAAPHHQDTWFPRLVEDPTFVMSHALTEPKGASDRWLPYNAPQANLDTWATLADGHWVINGQKQFITNAPCARLFVVYANTNPAVGIRDGTSSFLVPRDTPGMTIGPQPGAVYLEECRIPEDHLLVRDVTPAKVLLAATAPGRGVAALEETVAFCKSRFQGGRSIIQHQLVGASPAHLATKLESVRALTFWAARAVDAASPDAATLAQMAYLHAAEMVFDVSKRVVELWAGMGTVPEVGIERWSPGSARSPRDGKAVRPRRASRSVSGVAPRRQRDPRRWIWQPSSARPNSPTTCPRATRATGWTWSRGSPWRGGTSAWTASCTTPATTAPSTTTTTATTCSTCSTARGRRTSTAWSTSSGRG